MKQVAILQSNYIPWKGYFDLIAAVDEFIVYDDMQYTKNDWRNRNRIKTPNGLEWLTIPTGQNINRRIRDVELAPGNWQAKHWKSLVANYAKAPCWHEVAAWLQPLYLDRQHRNLSELNVLLIQAVCDYLGITTRITRSWTTPWAKARPNVWSICASRPEPRTMCPGRQPGATLMSDSSPTAPSSSAGSTMTAIRPIHSNGANSVTRSAFSTCCSTAGPAPRTT